MMSVLTGPGFSAKVFSGFPVVDSSEQNADVHVQVADGRAFAGVVATLANLEQLLLKYRSSGDCADGAFVWIRHLVVVRDFDLDTIQRTIADLVATDEIASVFEPADAS